MAQIKIAVDAGHGSNTAGKRTCKLTRDIGQFKKGTQVREHWINVYIAERLHDNLIGMGYSVFKSAWNDSNATDDDDVALSTRQSNIKKQKCDYSVSIHLNAAGDGVNWHSGNGTEVLVHSDSKKVGDSKTLGTYVLSELIKGTPQKNRGLKTDNLAMCNCSALGTTASILVECAFMTNQHEVETMITKEDYWEETAKEIADGINKYILSKLKTPTTSIKKTSSVNDVMWLQIKLNMALKSFGSKTVLSIDGQYGTKTKNAVLEFWKLLGWNKGGKDDGTVAGQKTRTKLLTYN